ncbi:hypothetical protein [Perlucidibaca piscinae]|uniref:hypothetical protein n=1 Tax=Perlucidibaca piscinae TaxID=392589 RepID=UPI0003B3F558|nr:hypothetical protein [Perlucidibaca piscinae]
MSGRDEDGFDVRPGTPKGRHQRFVSQVIREASKAGGRALNRPAARTGASLGRGKVASRMMGQGLGRKARRVVIKTRLVNLQRAGTRSTITHLRYIEREGVGPEGEQGQAYGLHTDDADMDGFERRVRDDRHQFRCIVSPADADQLGDLKSYTRELMIQVQVDLGTSLDWVAVDHWNTDNPHTHIVLRGKQHDGRDLVIAREYISSGMRKRGSEIATRWLGPRTELEIQRDQMREVERPGWTELDRALQRMAPDGRVTLERLAERCPDQRYRRLLIGRLQYLEGMGLCDAVSGPGWIFSVDLRVRLHKCINGRFKFGISKEKEPFL